MASSSSSLLRTDFLQTLVYFVRNVHHASTPAAHLKALREVQAYLDSLTAENHQAAQQLVLDRSRLAQQCKVPQFDGRFCDIICDKSDQLGHQETFTKIQEALAELWAEEQLIDQWRKALVLPLHCLQPPASFRGPEQPRASAAVRREQGRRHPDLEQLLRPTVVLPPPHSSRPGQPQVPANPRPQASTHSTQVLSQDNYVDLDPPSSQPE